jgi:cation diffusion facilitator CzcD-associated flavoprotein CzcO
MMSRPEVPSGKPRGVIIVGAGLFGLAAAKTYLEVNPNIDLTILDSDSSVGGTWSSSRVYPELTADSPVPTFEFGDMSMIDEFDAKMWSDIKGKMVAQYLDRYARRFKIVERCRLNTDVLRVERSGKGWKVWIQWMDFYQLKVEVLYCDVLILATGMTSKPCTPKCDEMLARTESILKPCFPTMDTSKYQGPIIHTKDLNDCSAILKKPHVKDVTVVGGNKSAAEAVSICVSAGKIVNWVIRENGSGPGMLVNAKITGKHGAEIGNCKLGTLFMPSIHGKRGWWYWFLQSGRNPLGGLIFIWFWTFLTKLAVGNRYEKSPNGKLLKPDVCK